MSKEIVEKLENVILNLQGKGIYREASELMFIRIELIKLQAEPTEAEIEKVEAAIRHLPFDERAKAAIKVVREL